MVFLLHVRCMKLLYSIQEFLNLSVQAALLKDVTEY